MHTSEINKIIETMAKAGYERFFDDKWDDLPAKSIERELWCETVKTMLRAVPFPTFLYQVCQFLSYEQPSKRPQNG